MLQFTELPEPDPEDRYYPNPMCEILPESPSTPEELQEAARAGNLLPKILAMPYALLSVEFVRAASRIKETIVAETWGFSLSVQRVGDFTLYSGLLGTAFLLFKSYQVTHNLALCSHVVEACDAASLDSRDVTFICGRAGVCALGAVAAKYGGGNRSLDHYLVEFQKVFEDKEFSDAALAAGEVVWDRGLLKRVGICHGISGNAYVFLSLYQLTKNVKYLYRAKAFACFLLDRAHKLIPRGEMDGGDEPYSLFEGKGGMAYLLFDMFDPYQSKFPAYELRESA